ncbi:MAG: peptidyl-prolyl cis-trans isomerase [Deltaproteobacteria bacterium]|nr:peptidyl-prolyl cis-trans isomerase [Deltaproteobacteria bacterium]
MKKVLMLLLAAAFVFLAGPFVEAGDKPAPPQVVLKTSMGDIAIELDREKAPKTVANFLNYARSGYYDGTIFHRVIPRFMIQGGGFTPDMKKKTTEKHIQNEADNGLKNERGTIAMARTQDPHSASAQFFINTADNAFLNHKNKDARGWGYAVFGKVVDGMAVVDAIEKVKTGNRGMFKNVPVETVVIEKAYVK